MTSSPDASPRQPLGDVAGDTGAPDTATAEFAHDSATAEFATVDGPGPADPLPARRRHRRRPRHWSADRAAVLAGTLAFAAVCLGFLLNTPTLIGPDEPYHMDRVIAAEHGQIVLAPEAINVSRGERGLEHTYVRSQMRRASASQAEYTPIARSKRPSLDALGGNARSPKVDVSNYETQHPPLYYAIMGGLLRLWPHADAMAGDKLVLLTRTFNVLLMLPLSFLFFASARALLGTGPVARASAFLPLLVPGLARCAATVNNDNLAIVIGAAVVLYSIKIMQGDRSVRTAVVVSALCVAGSLTKGTVLFILTIVPLAYLVQWLRARALPDWKVASVLGAGAVAAAAWWVHNYIAYGSVQPQAWGVQFARAQGSPRPLGTPLDMAFFRHVTWKVVPSRFWAALGLHEPPQLPRLMIDLMSLGLVLFLVATLAVLRGRRWTVLVLAAVPIGEQIVVIMEAYLHYRHYLAIPALQGRYVYPAVFGVLLPFAVVAVLVLGRRWSKWAPMLVLAVGLLVSGWALYTSAEYTWLHRGERLVPGNWSRAYHTLEGFFALSPAVLLTLTILGAALLVGAVVLTAPWRRGPDDELVGWRELARRPSVAADALRPQPEPEPAPVT